MKLQTGWLLAGLPILLAAFLSVHPPSDRELAALDDG